MLGNPAVTLTGERELFLPERDDICEHMEAEVLFSLLVSRTAWVLSEYTFKDKARGFPTSSHGVHSQQHTYWGLFWAAAKPPAPVPVLKEGLKIGGISFVRAVSDFWPCAFSLALVPALDNEAMRLQTRATAESIQASHPPARAGGTLP